MTRVLFRARRWGGYTLSPRFYFSKRNPPEVKMACLDDTVGGQTLAVPISNYLWRCRGAVLLIELHTSFG